MKTLKLTSDGDLDVSELGIHLIDGPARVAQQVQTRLRTFLGEWEFDLEAGTPWFQSILGIKGVNMNEVESLLKKQILDVADTVAVLAFSMSFNQAARTLSITGKISTAFGVVAVDGIFP